MTHSAIHRMFALSLLIVSCLTAESASAAAEDSLFRKVVTIIRQSRTEAEQQVIALHVQSTFSLLKDEVARY